VSYDLYAWPVDRAMPRDEAIAEVERRVAKWAIGLGRDRRIDAFVHAVELRFPKLRTAWNDVPMEFDVHRDWVFMGLGWSYVAELIEAIAPIAFEEGIALYDPQRELVAMPRPFADAPLGLAGVAAHERSAEHAIDLVIQGVSPGSQEPIGDPAALLRAAAVVGMSPLGFEITPDIQAEVAADPTRVPSTLQSASRKAGLMTDLAAADPAVRHQALTMLGGWDPDPEVRRAVLPLLGSDDVFVAGLASSALARQGETGDLPAVLETVRRMSPSEGGTADAMLLPLRAALDLAALAGADAIADVKVTATSWREPPSGARHHREHEIEAELGRLLDPGHAITPPSRRPPAARP
jgi:hypothetical protein